MKNKILPLILLIVVIIKIPIGVNAVEDGIRFHRADTIIFFKNSDRNPFGLLYFYLASTTTVHNNTSIIYLTMEVSLQSWGNETYQPPIVNVTLIDLIYGYGFYPSLTEPIITTVSHPSRLHLNTGETKSWSFNSTVPTQNIEVHAYMEVHGGIQLTMSDGQKLMTPVTIQISTDTMKSISYEIPIFNFNVQTWNMSLYLDSKYHSFIFNETITPTKTELKKEHEQLTLNWKTLDEEYDRLKKDYEKTSINNTELMINLESTTNMNHILLGIFFLMILSLVIVWFKNKKTKQLHQPTTHVGILY